MPGGEQVGDLPVVVALGSVDPALVSGVLDGHCRFVATPGDAELAAAEGAIARADARVDRALLGRAPALRVIARTGVGHRPDRRRQAATARGIAVVITPGAGAAAVAEGAIGMALHLVKRFGPLTALVRDGRWAERAGVSVGDLDGATLGMVGYGRIGRRAAALAPAFGMTGPGLRPVSEPPAPSVTLRRASASSRARSDVITLHLPLNDADPPPGRRRVPGPGQAGRGPGQLRPRRAARHRRRRGGALTDGRLSGVGLDVFDPEPPGRHPLFDHPDVVLTPHLMGLSRRATAATFAAAARGVARRALRPRAAGRRRSRLAHPQTTKETTPDETSLTDSTASPARPSPGACARCPAGGTSSRPTAC